MILGNRRTVLTHSFEEVRKFIKYSYSTIQELIHSIICSVSIFPEQNPVQPVESGGHVAQI
jgi:hypothetical protein